jgi:hypothetical protein
MKKTLLFSLALLAGTRAGAQVFMRPADNAAISAMGGVAVSLPDAGRGVHNDALLGMARGVHVFASSAMPYGIAGWTNSHAQLVAGLSPASAATIRLWHNAAAGYSEQRLSAGYGRRLSEKIMIGLSADGLRRAAETYQPDFLISCTAGVLTHILPQLWLGCTVQNPFPQQSDGIWLPVVFRTGATWKPGDTFLFSIETQKIAGKPASVQSGMEYRPQSRFALRAGVRTGGGARLSFGTACSMKNGLTFHAATEWRADLGITPTFMISRTFAPTDQINNKHS